MKKPVYIVFSEGYPVYFVKNEESGKITGYSPVNAFLCRATKFDSKEEAWKAAEESKLALCEVKEYYSFDE